MTDPARLTEPELDDLEARVRRAMSESSDPPVSREFYHVADMPWSFCLPPTVLLRLIAQARAVSSRSGAMTSTAVQRTKTYAICPHCGADAGCVDHLLADKKPFNTAWYCDTCGRHYALAVTATGDVETDKMFGRRVPTLNVLVLRPQTKPVYFVVEGSRWEGEPWSDEGDAVEHARFYYEEHSCPTNWFEPVAMHFDGDDDPHGLIEFVAQRDLSAFPPDDDPVGPNDHDLAVRAFIDEAKSVPAPPPGDGR